MKLLRGLLLKPTLNLLGWILRRSPHSSLIIGSPLGWSWQARATVSELPAMTDEKIWKGTGGNVEEIDVPAGGYTEGARVYPGSAQPIPNDSYTVLTFDTEEWDTNNIHDPTTNPERLTCKTAGKYLVIAHLVFAANATGIRKLYLQLSGGTVYIDDRDARAAGTTYLSVCCICDLAVNNYVTAMAYQNSGGNLNTATYTRLMMQRIG